MLGLLLAAPFIATPAIVQSALNVSSSAPALIVLCLTFAASWLAALSIALLLGLYLSIPTVDRDDRLVAPG